MNSQRFFRACCAFLILFFAAHATAHEDDLESMYERIDLLGCVKANKAQLVTVNRGNSKRDSFLQKCAEATANSPWCAQMIRPNPGSLAVFRCTYGNSQVHQLIHPDESTWKHAFATVMLVEELQKEGIGVCEIYNWWRPEPYNKNVGGAAGRHPYATSADVRFCSKQDQENAFVKLCELRKMGRLRAVGYYPSAALHFGVGDSRANTWGKECPN